MIRPPGMKHYLVSLHGENILVEVRGERRKHGFHTKRYVEAASEEQAERRALRLIFNDPGLHKVILNAEDDTPSISAVDIRVVDNPGEKDCEDIKINYYPEGDD